MTRNRLGGETSPYLLQHALNPVHWWPWGKEALDEARKSGKPILLSVGYSACHWCHVMAHESFEDPGIAGLMNDLFINIKVDREERPDLDSVYQMALAMMGQHGGWPLTMFLTPEAEPFWGGTYFPPTARYGRAAFPDVLEGIAATFRNNPDKIRHNITQLRHGLERLAASPGSMPLDAEIALRGARDVLTSIDMADGGTYGAPKFPQPALFKFLWTMHERSGDESLAQAVILTLDHICQGGIYDHLGGGFMRYSTDQMWLVPHFEKMLYDNALLISLLCRVWRRTGKDLYRERVEESIGWLLREMIAEDGAFAAALDADSDGHEGLFYTWTLEEVAEVVGVDATKRLSALYDIRPEGNWEERNILHRNHRHGSGDGSGLETAKAALLTRREGRVRPGRDHKVLADWNGMMIAALAEAAVTFGRPRWLDAAIQAFTVVTERMARPQGRLYHSLCRGRAAHGAVVEDYAHMSLAALALARVTGDQAFLDHATRWLETAHHDHWDAEDGGYFTASKDASDVIVKTKSSFDSATPSANGAMAEALALMALASGEAKWRQRAQAVVDTFSAAIPEQLPNMASLLDAYMILTDPVEVTIQGPIGDVRAEGLMRAALAAPGQIHWLRRMTEGEPSAIICRGSVCSRPIETAEALTAALAE